MSNIDITWETNGREKKLLKTLKKQQAIKVIQFE